MNQSDRRKFLKRLGLIGLASTTVSAGTATANNHNQHGQGQNNRRTRGRLDPLGHELTENSPIYTFGDVNDDGTWGVISSWVGFGSSTTSTLYDLSDLEDPQEVHRVETQKGADSNHIRFDGTRDGLYYRALERGDVDGVEVIDFGWGDGTPEEPKVIAEVETPNTGVHALCAHPTEEVMYLIDKGGSEPGVIPMDVSDPKSPELADLAGPNGYCHAVEADPIRGVLHCAFIAGDFVGYSILDITDPLEPEEIGSFDYDAAPDYTEVGEEGFESCHHAQFDPERDIAVVGDETAIGIPGGKHVFDIGWGDGSLEDPEPIGFVASPDAQEMDFDSLFWWTTHFHDIVPTGDETLLVDGGYRNGFWIANITDPENPVATERYATDEDADIAGGGGLFPDDPPFAWGAVYNSERDFVFVSDTLTGAYTFDVSELPARGKNGGGPANYYDGDDAPDNGGDGDKDRQIFSPLTHGQSQQDPDRSGSTGFVTFDEKDDGTLSFELTAKNIEGVTQVHIHGEAGRKETAGVVAGLVTYTEGVDGSGDGEPEDGPIEERGTVEDTDLVEDILDTPGQYYVNIHTVENPAGEIRGQLRERRNDQSEMR